MEVEGAVYLGLWLAFYVSSIGVLIHLLFFKFVFLVDNLCLGLRVLQLIIIIASQNWRAFGSRISALFGFMEIFVFGFFMLRIETKRKVCIVEFG